MLFASRKEMKSSENGKTNNNKTNKPFELLAFLDLLNKFHKGRKHLMVQTAKFIFQTRPPIID